MFSMLIVKIVVCKKEFDDQCKGPSRFGKLWETGCFQPALASCRKSFMVPSYDPKNKKVHDDAIQECKGSSAGVGEVIVGLGKLFFLIFFVLWEH